MKSLGISLWCATLGALLGGLAFPVVGSERPPAELDTSGETCRCADDATSTTRQILAILSQPLKSGGLDFSEEPLENICDFLQAEYEISILIDKQALEENGFTSDEPMSINVSNVSLRSALRLMLERKQLTYIVQNEVVLITTPEVADENLVTCVYDVRDLAAFLSQPTKDGRRIFDYDSLIDAIVSCVAPETWAEAGGGEAEIRPLPPGLLVVSQTRMVHDEVAALLATIRETLQLPAPVSRTKAIAPAMGMAGPEGRTQDDPLSEPRPTSAEDDLFK